MKGLFIFTSICSLTGFFPFLVGFRKRKLVNKRDYLFIIYVAIAFFAELFLRIFIIFHLNETSRILSNLYILFEGFIFMLMFHNWNVIRQQQFLFIILIILLSVWLIDNFIFSTIKNTNSLYNVTYSVATVLLSIKLFQQEFKSKMNYILNDSYGIISFTLIVNFTYRAIFECLYLFKLDFSNNFYLKAFMILIILNALSNCTFTYAIVCLKQKRRLSSYF